MADHAHQRILEAVQTVLAGAGTAAGSRVFLDRLDEIPQDDLPAIDILGPGETGEDSVEYLTVSFPSVLQHSYTFAVRAVVAQTTGAAKAARNLAGEIEAVLLADSDTIAVDGRAIDMRMGDVAEQKDGAAALPMFAVRQTWQAQYQTLAGEPAEPI